MLFAEKRADEILADLARSLDGILSIHPSPGVRYGPEIGLAEISLIVDNRGDAKDVEPSAARDHVLGSYRLVRPNRRLAGCFPRYLTEEVCSTESAAYSCVLHSVMKGLLTMLATRFKGNRSRRPLRRQTRDHRHRARPATPGVGCWFDRRGPSDAGFAAR